MNGRERVGLFLVILSPGKHHTMSKAFPIGAVIQRTNAFPLPTEENESTTKEPIFAHYSGGSTAVNKTQKLLTEPQRRDCQWDLTV